MENAEGDDQNSHEKSPDAKGIVKETVVLDELKIGDRLEVDVGGSSVSITLLGRRKGRLRVRVDGFNTLGINFPNAVNAYLPTDSSGVKDGVLHSSTDEVKYFFGLEHLSFAEDTGLYKKGEWYSGSSSFRKSIDRITYFPLQDKKS